ncbi:MAG: AAA family ATPase [Sulfurimonas sp.]|nr:AAA family ATPase [Sulfurimonas sp.]
MSNIMLEKLYIHNFKSFYNSKFEFGKVNCLIAPNNTGKSNLIDALKFLNDLIYDNPARAVSKIGLKNIKNFHYDENEIKLNAMFKVNTRVLVGDELINYDISLLFVYTFDFQSKKPNIDIRIEGKIKSIIIDKADLLEGLGLRVYGQHGEYIDRYMSYYSSELSRKNYRSFNFNYNHITLNYEISGTRLETTDDIVKNLFALDISKKNETLHTPMNFIFIFNKSSLFASHYFHAHDIKRTQESGYDYLLENGTNLPEFLKSLEPETFEDISTSLIGEVELINSIELHKGFTTELIFKEELNDKVYPIEMKNVSDGTIHFIAIMSSILGNPFSIGMLIEEPERHMHMKVLSTILNTMRDDDKQMFFTTHSTEILQQLELDEIVFMFRDYDGNTKGQRAKDIPNIKKIMKLFKNDLIEMIKMGVLGEYDE